jgi:hypothetical protein
MIKKSLRWIWILSFCLLTSCASKLTSDNFNKIENGMTEQQVKAILGEPASVESSGALGLSATTYSYKQGNSEVKIFFANGKVLSKSGSFSK